MYDFILDAMLGKEAKWLRILGYSVYYSPKAEDNYLIEAAFKNSSILITKDTLLFKKAIKRQVRCILVKTNNIEEFLYFLRKRINLKLEIDLDNTRCPICNGVLVKVKPIEIFDKVPFNVFKKYNIFLKCNNCGHIYWPGSHLIRMRALLNKVKVKCGY